MRPLTWKLIGVAVVVVAVGVLVGLYVSKLTNGGGFSVVHVPGADGERPPGGQPDDRDRRRRRPAAQPRAPGLRLVPDPEHEGQVGARHRLAAARERDRARDRSTTSTAPAACATAIWRGRRASTATRSPSTARRRTIIPPDDASHTFAVPAYRTDRRAPRCRRQREEPVRLRAVRAVVRPPHDHVHLPHRQGGPLPLAVLRALRGRLARTASAARCRRSATWTDS